MAKIETRAAKSWFKCASCQEQIRTDEKYLQVVQNGKPVRGEKYCIHCEKYARLNNPESEEDSDYYDDGERHLRQMEDYAAYSAAGCTSSYWTDRDNGYCS